MKGMGAMVLNGGDGITSAALCHAQRCVVRGQSRNVSGDRELMVFGVPAYLQSTWEQTGFSQRSFTINERKVAAGTLLTTPKPFGPECCQFPIPPANYHVPSVKHGTGQSFKATQLPVLQPGGLMHSCKSTFAGPSEHGISLPQRLNWRLFLSYLTAFFMSQHAGGGRCIQVLGKETQLKDPSSLGKQSKHC